MQAIDLFAHGSKKHQVCFITHSFITNYTYIEIEYIAIQGKIILIKIHVSYIKALREALIILRRHVIYRRMELL